MQQPILYVSLSSGLSPSVLEFHQIHRSLDVNGSRTLTAGSELHRPRNNVGEFSHKGGEFPVLTRLRRPNGVERSFQLGFELCI